MTNTNQTNDETSEIERHLRSRVEEIENKAMYLQHNLDNGINVVLSASNDSAIKLCQAYDAGHNGDIGAWVHVMGFLASLIETIEVHLEDEGIDPYER